MTKRMRRRLFVDRSVQGALLLRVAAYWAYCLLSVALMMTCWMIVFDRPASSVELLARLWIHLGPALVASVVLLPMVVIDCLRLSNRFAGPMFRLRQAMRQLADGEPVQPIHFRTGDFWYEFAEQFNRISQRSTNSDSPEKSASAS